MPKKVLVIDDEPDVQKLVADSLRAAGFLVTTASDGGEGLEKVGTELPALIVLDLMLPGLSGLEVCKKVRSNPQTAGIFTIMLTARHEEYDRVVGFELGADDYMCKPFSPKELILRVKSVLRRGLRETNGVLEIGSLRIDLTGRQVRVADVPVLLTATEFKILASLAEYKGRVLTRQNLLDRVWGGDTSGEGRTIDVHVRHLREKLGPSTDCIETIRGFGYRLSEVGNLGPD